MRKLFPALIIACLIFNVNCTKVKKELPCGCVLPPLPPFSAQKNGAPWVTTSYSATIIQDSLKTIGYTNDTEVLSITIKYTGTGQYNLTGSQVYYHNTTSPLVPLANLSDYVLDNTAINTFSISTYDSSTSTVSGTFNLSLIKTYGAPNTGFPQNLNFLHGNFKLLLSK